MNRVIQSQLRQEEPMGVTCGDVEKHCWFSIFGSDVIAGYAIYDECFFSASSSALTNMFVPVLPAPVLGCPGSQEHWLYAPACNEACNEARPDQVWPGCAINYETGMYGWDVGNAVGAGEDTAPDVTACAFLGRGHGI